MFCKGPWIIHWMKLASGRSWWVRKFSLRDGTLLTKGIGRCNLLIGVRESKDRLRSLPFSFISLDRYYLKQNRTALNCFLHLKLQHSALPLGLEGSQKIFFPAGNNKLNCVILIAHTYRGMQNLHSGPHWARSCRSLKILQPELSWERQGIINEKILYIQP